MNTLFVLLGLARLKPLVTILLLPPVPFLLIALAGLMLIRRRGRVGVAMLWAGLSLTLLSGCIGVATAVTTVLLPLPAALSAERIAGFGRETHEPVAIIVLGSGVEDWAPEYETSSLSFRSLERLRYGIWLGRRTGWPTGFSGGVGWGQSVGHESAAEATVAQRIATEEFGRPLQWVESASRDTQENALYTIAMLKPAGIKHIVLVTHAWHMPRAVRNFERAAGDASIRIEAAPMGMSANNEWPLARWMPTGEGLLQTRVVLREWIGLISGA